MEESRTPKGSVVATYESRAGAEAALRALRDGGLDVKQAKRDVKSGKFLVLAGGSAQEIGRACALLGTTGPSELIANAA